MIGMNRARMIVTPPYRLVEFVGLEQVLLVREPRVLVVEDLGSDVVADGVIDGVAEDRRDDEQDAQSARD